MINNYTVINNYIMKKRLFRQQRFYFFVGKVVFSALHTHNLNNSKSEFDSSPRFLSALRAITFARGNLCYSLLYLRCIKNQAGKKFVQQGTHLQGGKVSLYGHVLPFWIWDVPDLAQGMGLVINTPVHSSYSVNNHSHLQSSKMNTHGGRKQNDWERELKS